MKVAICILCERKFEHDEPAGTAPDLCEDCELAGEIYEDVRAHHAAVEVEDQEAARGIREPEA